MHCTPHENLPFGAGCAGWWHGGVCVAWVCAIGQPSVPHLQLLDTRLQVVCQLTELLDSTNILHENLLLKTMATNEIHLVPLLFLFCFCITLPAVTNGESMCPILHDFYMTEFILARTNACCNL